MTRLGVVIGLALSTLGAGYLFTGLGRASEMARRTKCSSSLRHLALAAIQHADDRGAYPHVRGPDELDGGVETSDTPRVFRSLVQTGYMDYTGVFACASSNDTRTERAEGTWWTSNDPATAPTLAEARDVSYGWTRRALNANVRSNVQIAADRAVRHDAFLESGVTSDDPLQGNHVGGLNAAQADGSVMWWATGHDASFDGLKTVADLTRTDDPRAGALAIVDPLRPRAPTSRGWFFGGLGADALALVPLGLAGAVFLLARPPAPPRPSRPPRRARRPRSGRVAPLEVATDVQAEQRCPYCHDALATPDAAPVALTSCSACRAVFHADCVPEDDACTTLGCEARAGG